VTGDARYTGTPTYDADGNMTALGGTTMAYDNADRHLRSMVPTTPTATTVLYTRDALDRITLRSVNGTVVAKYAYCGTSDSPCATLNAARTALEKVIAVVGGATLTKTTAADAWGHPNIHGDIVAQTNTAGVKVGSTSTYDPYGQPLTTSPEQLTGNLDFGWLGEHQRPTEHESILDTIEMGARQYLPGLGRFIEPDPVEGGSSNDYDYVGADPLNALDLDGRCIDGYCNIAAAIASGRMDRDSAPRVRRPTRSTRPFTCMLCAPKPKKKKPDIRGAWCAHPAPAKFVTSPADAEFNRRVRGTPKANGRRRPWRWNPNGRRRVRYRRAARCGARCCKGRDRWRGRWRFHLYGVRILWLNSGRRS
jgi:RHS repeat-associated protein